MTWYLHDTATRRAYLDVPYATREAAEAARAELLPVDIYPRNHEWRRRLVVALGAPLAPKAKPRARRAP